MTAATLPLPAWLTDAVHGLVASAYQAGRADALAEAAAPTSSKPAPGGEEYLTRQEAAARLRISLATLDLRISRGELASHKLGARRLIRAADLLAHP